MQTINIILSFTNDWRSFRLELYFCLVNVQFPLTSKIRPTIFKIGLT